MLKLLLLACAAICLAGCSTPRRPNILLILTDDLGYGEVGCYGQKRIRTPNIDALAAAGMRFTDAYSGAPVCAPARCCLLTGMHTGHAAIRDNREVQPEGQYPLPEGTITIASILKSRGYSTAAIGKWGLGPPGSSGDPFAQGFDRFFGYNCQRHAHNHCPPWLYDDRNRIELAGNAPLDTKQPGLIDGKIYAPDLMRDRAVEFIRSRGRSPWFLLFATPVPHVSLQVPEDSLAEYRGVFDDPPYDGKKGYVPHPNPRAAYAAMVTRMDRDVGAMLAEINRLGLADDTIVIFSSDNGPTYAGGANSGFFESAAGLRGLKGQLYEGGIRVPLIVRWPGTTAPGSVCRDPVAHWDVLATLDEATGGSPRAGDGVSLVPSLQGKPLAERGMYWEHAPGGFWQATRIGQYKAVRRQVRKSPDGPIELYDLAVDPAESNNIAAAHPERVEQARALMSERTPSPIREWNP